MGSHVANNTSVLVTVEGDIFGTMSCKQKSHTALQQKAECIVGSCLGVYKRYELQRYKIHNLQKNTKKKSTKKNRTF